MRDRGCPRWYGGQARMRRRLGRRQRRPIENIMKQFLADNVDLCICVWFPSRRDTTLCLSNLPRQDAQRKEKHSHSSQHAKDQYEESTTYQIRQRIQLLSHQTALAPPPRNLPIHKVKKQAKRHESQSSPDWSIGVRGSEAESHGADDGHETTESWMQWN